MAFSTILNNLDGADVDGSFSTASCLQDNGSYSVVDMKSAAETAQEAGLSLFGGTLCSDQGQCASYYNSLIEPVIIPFVPEEGSIVVADFEKDALGTSYPLTGRAPAPWWKTPTATVARCSVWETRPPV